MEDMQKAEQALAQALVWGFCEGKRQLKLKDQQMEVCRFQAEVQEQL
jgi:hypothetical protein